MIAALGLGALAARAQDFDALAGDPLAAVLPPELAAGADFQVRDPVASDGLMHHFIVDSHYGSFEAYGREGLVLRRREIAALAVLAETSELGVVANAVGGSVTGSARTVLGVATHPIDTLIGIPHGISHLFQGYVAQARELGSSAKNQSKAPAGADSGHEVDPRRYVARYFGVTASERAWYRKLGVDPYTDNAPLRRAVQWFARVDATTKFGLKFAGLPGLPYAGELGRAMDAIYNEDPAVLRERRQARLAGYGLSSDEIQRFENTLLLTPTRQHLLDAAAIAMAGVEDRADLFRHAIGLASDAEAEVYLRSVLLLAARHALEPVASILPGLRMPAARAADGTVVVCAALDAVRWTEDVVRYEADARAALGRAESGADLWLAAPPSPRAALELAARGWRIHVSSETPPPAAPR